MLARLPYSLLPWSWVLTSPPFSLTVHLQSRGKFFLTCVREISPWSSSTFLPDYVCCCLARFSPTLLLNSIQRSAKVDAPVEVPTDIWISAHPNDSLREQISVHPNDTPHEQIMLVHRANAINEACFGISNRLGYGAHSWVHGDLALYLAKLT